MIIEVDDTTLLTAAKIHSESWQSSHRAFCSEDFIQLHTPEHQREYLKKEMDGGKRLYMLIRNEPVGIVSVYGDMIENLYVHPSEQRKGYGTELLLFAMERCTGIPCLWVLDNNKSAYGLYIKHGFRPTGREHRLSDTLSELEMRFIPDDCRPSAEGRMEA